MVAADGASWAAIAFWFVLACTDGLDGWIARPDQEVGADGQRDVDEAAHAVLPEGPEAGPCFQARNATSNGSNAGPGMSSCRKRPTTATVWRICSR